MRRRLVLAAVMALVVASLAAGVALPAEAPTRTVAMPGKLYEPAALDVLVGTTVTWKNDDSTNHTVTADEDAFSSGYVPPGGSFTFTFATQGHYAFHCTIHRFMRGTVDVFGLVLAGPEGPVTSGRRVVFAGLAPPGAESVTLRGGAGERTVRARPDGSFALGVDVVDPGSFVAHTGLSGARPSACSSGRWFAPCEAAVSSARSRPRRALERPRCCSRTTATTSPGGPLRAAGSTAARACASSSPGRRAGARARRGHEGVGGRRFGATRARRSVDVSVGSPGEDPRRGARGVRAAPRRPGCRAGRAEGRGGARAARRLRRLPHGPVHGFGRGPERVRAVCARPRGRGSRRAGGGGSDARPARRPRGDALRPRVRGVRPLSFRPHQPVPCDPRPAGARLSPGRHDAALTERRGAPALHGHLDLRRVHRDA